MRGKKELRYSGWEHNQNKKTAVSSYDRDDDI